VATQTLPRPEPALFMEHNNRDRGLGRMGSRVDKYYKKGWDY